MNTYEKDVYNPKNRVEAKHINREIETTQS